MARPRDRAPSKRAARRAAAGIALCVLVTLPPSEQRAPAASSTRGGPASRALAEAAAPAPRRTVGRLQGGRPTERAARREDARLRRIRPTGRLHEAAGSTPARGRGPVVTFDVSVERGLGVRAATFARYVERILFAPRGWARVVAFERVSRSAAGVHVILASPSLTDRLCAPAATVGRFSCHNDGNVVINFMRWTHGAPAYRGRLARYRTYVVNHEVGHALGRGHLACPGPGRLAPVMMQQTKGVGECRPNPWPRPYEL